MIDDGLRYFTLEASQQRIKHRKRGRGRQAKSNDYMDNGESTYLRFWTRGKVEKAMSLFKGQVLEAHRAEGTDRKPFWAGPSNGGGPLFYGLKVTSSC